jgi:hypothetical protein
VNEQPIFTASEVVFTFSESVALGSIVSERPLGSMEASDPEDDRMTFTLSQPSTMFAFDISGNILLKEAVDFETLSTYVVQVTVSDGSLLAAGTLPVKFNIEDYNEPQIWV